MSPFSSRGGLRVVVSRFAGVLMLVVGVTFAPEPLAASQAVAAEVAPCADTATSAADAIVLAKACNRMVEVASTTSEISRTVAHPSGMFEWEQHVVPVRVRRTDGWVPVDTNLHVLADGRLAAVASTVDVRFSGGGTGPLVTITSAGGTASLSWSQPLPTPRVEGDSAVYSEVLAGVDLRVRATADGFSHALVVKNVAAAANPALRTIAFGWSVDGLTVSAAADGSVQVTDGTQVVVVSQPALMWDSSTAAAGGQAAAVSGSVSGDASDADAPGDLARTAPVGVSLSGGQMVLTPDVGLLTGADTVFPLFIDPVFGSPRKRWAYASQKGEGRTDGIARVGNDPAGDGLWRSFFEFGLGSSVAYKTIYDAKFYTTLTHSSSCGNSPVSLWETSNIAGGVGNGGKTPWSPSLRVHLDERYGHANQSVPSNCQGGPQDDMPMEFTGGLRSKVQDGVDTNWSLITLGLSTRRADGSGESTTSYWKKFVPGDTRLTIWYNTFPNTPTVKAHPSTQCFKVCTSSTGEGSSGSQAQGWWKLNETSGSTADDASPADRDGTASGGVSWADGAAVFNGSSAAVTTVTSPLNTTRSFSVSVWAKRVSGGTDYCQAAVIQQANVNPGFWLGTCGDRWEFGRSRVDSGAPASDYIHSQAPLAYNTWVHMVGVYNDLYGRFTFYLNGAMQGSTTLSTVPFTSTAGLIIGRSKYNGALGSYFAGSVDNVQTYQRELSPADVADLHDAGRAGGALYINAALVGTTQPTLSVGVSDPDSNAKLQTEFEVRALPDDTSTLKASSGNLPALTAPATVNWTVPSGKLSNGTTYFWRARSHDEVGWTGPWTTFHALRVDTSAPSTPSVSSSQYPRLQFGAVVGTQGTFTLSSTSSDTYEFEWWVDNNPSHGFVAASGSGPRTATVTWTPASPMKHFLHVIARDSAGNTSTYNYEFWVSSAPDVKSHWSLDETSGTAAADSGNATSFGGTLSPLTLSSTGVAFGPGWVKDAGGQPTNGLVFSGDGSAAADNPVIDTTKAITVMAWVNPSDLTADRTIVSQDGTGSSRLQLHFDRQANSGSGGWCASMRASDGATPVTVCTNGADLGYPATGQWTHVAVVYNPALSSQQLRIYVMGDPQSCFDPYPETAAVDFTGSWSATGSLVIGRAKAGGANSEYWRGSVDDVWAHQKALTGTEICQHAQP